MTEYPRSFILKTYLRPFVVSLINSLHATSLRCTISINYQIVNSIIRITLEYWYSLCHLRFFLNLSIIIALRVFSKTFTLSFVQFIAHTPRINNNTSYTPSLYRFFIHSAYFFFYFSKYS